MPISQADMVKDLREFLKTANDWEHFDLPLPYASVQKIQKSKNKKARLSLVRNPNKKRKGTYNSSLVEFTNDMADAVEFADIYGKILKAIEKVNPDQAIKPTPIKKDAKWEF